MKTKITTLLLLLTITTAFSQQLYFGGQAGVNIGVAKQTVNTYYYYTNAMPFANYTEENGDTYIENVPVSYAEGLNYSAHIGYMHGKYGIEISSAFLQSVTETASFKSAYSETNYEVSATSTSFKPVLVYKLDTTKLAFMCKLGAIISTSRILNRMYSDDGNGSTSDMQSIQTGNWNVGGYMAMGVEYKVTKGLSFKALIDFTMLGFSPTQAKLTKYERNGEDQMMFIPEENRGVTFFDKIKTPDYSQNEQLAPKYNLTSIGFNFGIYYTISFKK